MMEAIDLISSTFSTDPSKKYRLSIRENSGGFSFSVLDLEVNKCVAIKYLPCHTNLKDLKSNALLQLEYDSIYYYADAPFALVDRTILLDSDLISFLPIEQHKLSRVELGKISLDFNYQLIYDIHRYNRVDENQSNLHPIFSLLKLSQRINKMNVCVELQDKSLYVVVSNEKRIYLMNVFLVETAQDIAYFVMSLYTKLDLTTHAVSLTLFGYYSDEMNPRPFLTKYISQINMPLVSDLWNSEFPNSLYGHFATLID